MLNKNTLTAICSAVLLSFTSVNATAMEGKMTTEPSPIVNSKLSLETKWDWDLANIEYGARRRWTTKFA